MKSVTRREFVMIGASCALSAQETPKPAAGKYDPKANPEEDLRKAIRQAAREGKHIVLEVGGEWCSWCHRMEAFFDKNPALKEFRDGNYLLVRVNFSEENENRAFLSKFPKVDGYPHLFILDSAGKLLHSQNTGELEEGKSYDLERFTEFLKQYAPKRPSR